jgi:predicted DNA-binding protein
MGADGTGDDMQKLGRAQTKNMAVAFSGEMYEELTKTAAKLDRSKGWIVREAVREYLWKRAAKA